ncbi:MAG: hypothetical protein ACRCXZ_01100, partial [Patescibacteria group bacterium]
VRWNTQYYFFDKKDSEGNYNVKLENKDGLHKLYFYKFETSLFNKVISEKPFLVTKKFDFSTPKVNNLKIEKKYTNLNSTWSFESDEENPIIKFFQNGKESILFDPKSTFQDNKCKQEKISGGVKYNCPVVFEKEEAIKLSATIEDEVGNKTSIMNEAETVYVEPLKAECTQPPYKTSQDIVNLSCKTNRDTKFSLNNSAKEDILKGVTKVIPLQLGVGQATQQEYEFVLKFDDPNGSPIELSYKIFKDNTPPRIELDPKTNQEGTVYSVINEIKSTNESSTIEVVFDQASSPSSNWYYKYPENKSFNVSPSTPSTVQFYSSEFKLCGKDPITNTETCVGAYNPSSVTYTVKASDEVGNLSTYQCRHDLNSSQGASCTAY